MTHIPDRLLIFTRYPEPGRTKTRLIPALSAAGAAALHRRLTEHAVAEARRLRHEQDVALEVYFTGGNRQLMAAWLGDDLAYHVQAGEDLGMRLATAFAGVFTTGEASVVIMGTDCPDLTAPQLANALAALKTVDLVLGPASDGGYYLIGLKRQGPALFEDIAWGTERVLAQTHRAAQRLGMEMALLPELRDIDRPEDLMHAQAFLDGADASQSQ